MKTIAKWLVAGVLSVLAGQFLFMGCSNNPAAPAPVTVIQNQLVTATFTPTGSATSTFTITPTSPATATPTVALALSAHGPVLPASQNYSFNQVNASSLQVILTASAQENVLVKQMVFTGAGTVNWQNDVVAGSVGLYKDNSPASNGLYNGSDTLLLGSQSFDAGGSVTFVSLAGFVTLGSGVP